MIDTIVLLLSSDAFTITNPDRFIPNARWITNSRSSAVYGIQSRQNPTNKELAKGIYKPRLTLRTNLRNPKDIELKIELSLPKLFYGNNFQELKGKDLAPLLQKLSSTLGQMEVIVDPLELAKAPVYAIHYSKNILLKDGSTPYHYISKIKECDIKRSLDTNQTDYRNEGHSFKWHCNSYEIVFYDKLKDLEKAKQSEKRAMEKDSAIQLAMFPRLRKKKKLEVLRMEVRLNKRAKMKQFLATLNIKADLSLKSLFKATISKKVLLYYLAELESKRLPILDFKAADDKAFLTDLVVNNPHLSVKKIMQIYGLTKTLQVVSLRELRAIFLQESLQSWNRFVSETQKIKLPSKIAIFQSLKHAIR